MTHYKSGSRLMHKSTRSIVTISAVEWRNGAFFALVGGDWIGEAALVSQYWRMG